MVCLDYFMISKNVLHNPIKKQSFLFWALNFISSNEDQIDEHCADHKQKYENFYK